MISLNYEINEEELAQSVNDSADLENNEQMFEQLTSVTKAKTDLKDALEKIENIEIIAKGLINSKAKQLYGKDWQTIVGVGYKVTRSVTGSVYVRNPDIPVNKKFIELKESILTKVVDAEVEKTGIVPKGIEVNPNRNESIRINLK